MQTSEPLRVYLICPNPWLRQQIRGAMEEFREDVRLSGEGDVYPSGADLARALRTDSPHAVFLSFEKPEVAIAVMRFLESEAEGLPVVALHTMPDLNRMGIGMRAGTREFLTPPFEHNLIKAALETVRKLLKRAPLSYAATEHIYSFLPAKPGVGTSTVALNVSAALARQPGQKVLLADLDLTCGLVRFLLKLPQDLSIVDAITRSEQLDVAMWPQLVAHCGGLDILHSGTVNPQAYLEPAQIQGMIDFARGNYNALFFDLSGNLERHSLVVMHESRRVFLVCNPDPGSLMLAREKLGFLKSLGLGSRVSVIVNRSDQPMAIPSEHIARLLKVPVIAAFRDDELAIHASVKVAGPVDPKLPLGREYGEFARLLVAAHNPYGAGVAEQDDRVGLTSVTVA